MLSIYVCDLFFTFALDISLIKIHLNDFSLVYFNIVLSFTFKSKKTGPSYKSQDFFGISCLKCTWGLI